jgi:tetratricopeptide (TPR) repeat protein
VRPGNDRGVLAGRTAPALPVRMASRLAASLILCAAVVLGGGCGVSSDPVTASASRGVLPARPLRGIHKIRPHIEEANALVNRALSRREAGPYVLQALIASLHANSPHPGATDWAQIATLYERLLELTSNPLVKLNHAVAVGMATTPQDGLALLEKLDASEALQDYHLLYATRADFLRRLGRNAQAAEAYREALARARTDAERRYLINRLREVGASL